METEKIDLVKTDKAYYNPPTKPVEVTLAPYPYLTVTGAGAPGGEAHIAAIQSLFTLAYSLKFAYKAQNQDSAVAKLEGLWWFLDESKRFGEVPREEWQWKLLIRVPDFMKESMFKTVKAETVQKKPELVRITDVNFEDFNEGHCVQMMHVGSYASESETVAQIFAYMKEHNLVQNGKHHELYITDVSKNPETGKTILRYPVRSAS
ncbi:MAG TPA: GyrI-like domain-containing protein [Candidatus Saccharimonadales bacterium]|nr:GyrI-like domain-containing protein [Candidatus Saccharimonadales bacterium]